MNGLVRCRVCLGEAVRGEPAIEAAGLTFILGMKIPDVPYQVDKWRREHPGEEISDGHLFTQPWPAGPKDK